MKKVDVLVVGAGPTGLMLAGWMVRHGLDVMVVDPKPHVCPESRALAVHARTLETYDQLGIGEDALSRGRRGEGIAVWINRRHVTRVGLETMGEGISPHPYVYVLSQDQNEALLYAHLQRHGGEVAWRHKLLHLAEGGRGVLARIEGPEGEQEVEALYVCGCDGARSAVRHSLGMKFPGGTYAEEFYVADVAAHGDISEGDVNVCLDKGGFQLVFPMRGEGRFRLVGILPPALRGRDNLKAEDIVEASARPFGIEVTETNWFSHYKVHHRVASHFRLGRCFLVGDAAHVHSPVGGQGMNTGLMDASNLGWKLAAVIRRGASERLLDTYAQERVPFARRLVSTTDRGFALITSRAPWAPYLRMLFPRVVAFLTRFPMVQHLWFRVLSQTYINYRNSWTSSHHAPSTSVRAGDRLPWVHEDGGSDNFAPLVSCDWQAHVYGESSAALSEWNRLPVHRFVYTSAARKAGLLRDAVYLIRPDGYIGMLCRPFDSAIADQYLQERAGAAP